MSCLDSKERRPASWRPETVCVHAGTHQDPVSGGVCTPIYSSSAYVHPHPQGENVYQRYFNTPNQRAVAAKLAALENGEAALVFGSGMAAISTVLLSFLGPNDHAVFQADLYGGTHHLVSSDLTRFGIGVSYARTLDEFRSAITARTRLIYVESPSNPLLRCVDLAGIGELGRKRKLVTVVDNTFATPVNQMPLKLGFEVVVHSGTKYLNGHSDMNCGAAIGSAAAIRRIRETAMNLGGSLDALACSQLERGLKTLALRVRQHNANAAGLAAFLSEHPAVLQVNYPGLPGHPDHAVASRQMRGFGGMLSFELRDARRVKQVLRRFQVVTPALSLGGIESLICVPAQTSHVKLSAAERASLGIRDGLMRVSVGIEAVDDLIEDFSFALQPAKGRQSSRARSVGCP
ncbi:MAG: PLP-dependent transferase [Verrucomicrobiales bacterium]|nr:PLP-dependent transferase [Verrucomicrobiales bacterium]